MNVLIACHAGAELGLGHLTRSLEVARALQQELEAIVHILIQGDPVERSDLAEFNHRFFGPGESLKSMILQTAINCNAQVVVLDLHPNMLSADIDTLLKDLRHSGRRVIGVDGLVDHRDDLDLIFIPSFRFSSPASDASETPVLFGWDCYLLNVRGVAGEWLPGNRVLALTGGSDATKLGKTLPKLLEQTLPVDTELHWVTGPYARQPSWPASSRIRMLNHQSPQGLDELMVNVNYAITVFGVSFFELLHYGVPTVVFSPYGSKDDAELAGIANEGIARVAADEVEAVAKLNELIGDNALASSLSRSARQKLSVSGGHKLARAIAEMMA